MRLKIIAVGTRVPDWVATGFDEYLRRMPRDNRVELIAVPAADRRKARPVTDWQEEEAARLQSAATGCQIVALDERGRSFSTDALARRLEGWRMDGRDVAFLIGGADGLAPHVRQQADLIWSLSPLTLPHALVRVVLAEQLYRAWTIMIGHPYHR